MRLIIDSDEAVDLQMTTEIAKVINESGVLDHSFPSGCNLEVSSPGLTAPLTEPFQYKKHIGRNLKLSISQGGNEKRLHGKLMDADDKGIQLTAGKTDILSISYADIIEAKIKITFG